VPAPIPDDTRAAILEDITASEKSRAQISRDHAVSTTSVSKIAKDAGIVSPFSREKTKKATEASIVDHKARLSKAARRSLGVFETIIGSYEKMTSAQWDKVHPRDRGIIAGIMADKARELEPPDDNGAAAGRSMLGALAAGLQLAYDQLPPDDDQS
jgi:hypothetical protein